MLGLERGIYYGANITGGEGGVVKCESIGIGDRSLYTLTAVNTAQKEKLQTADKPLEGFMLEDLTSRGVKVIPLGKGNDQILGPGEKLSDKAGLHSVTIEGTAKQGVLFNGNAVT
jgi:hypothetical protein